MPHLQGKTIESRSLSVETVTPALDFDTAPIFGVYDHNKRAWYDVPVKERYHLDSGPKQLVNRYRDSHAEQAETLFSQFQRRWPPQRIRWPFPTRTEKALESLGLHHPEQ